MKKVQEYIKNVGKSFMYASVDVMKDTTPTIASFAETNQELFKDINHVIRDRRQLFSRLHQSFKGSKIYEGADAMRTSIWEDIRSGKFYNPERKEKMSARAMGFSDDDMDLDLGDFGGDDNWDISDGDEFLADTVESSSKANAEMVSTTVMKASEFIVKNQRDMNQVIMANQAASFNKMNSFLSASNDNISKIVEFNNKAMSVHIENSKNFYQEATKNIKEINALLKESTEMQRNLYNRKPDKEKEKITYNSIMNAEGIPDIKEYFKSVLQNAKNETGMLGSLGNMFEDGNIFLEFAGAPLEFIPKFFLGKFVHESFKKSAKKLDKTMEGFFSNVFAAFNDMKVNQDSDILPIIGRIFGVRNELKTDIDTTKYHRGDMSWNGTAQKALTEVIPTYLAQLVSLQSGQPEQIYNYKTGKFTDIVTIKKSRDDLIESKIRTGSSDMREEMMRMLDYFNFTNLEDKKKMQKDMQDFFTYFFKSGRRFDPRKLQDEYDGLSMDNENYEKIVKLFRMADKGKQMGFAKSMMEARDSLTREFKNMEEDVNNPYNLLYNNFTNRFNDKGKLKTDGFIKDDKGYSIHDYLNKITETMLEGVKVYVLNDPLNISSTSSFIGPPLPSTDGGSSNISPNTNQSAISRIMSRDNRLEDRTISSSSNSLSSMERDEENYQKEKEKRQEQGISLDFDTLTTEQIGQHVLFKEQERIRKLEEEENNKSSFLDSLIGTTLAEKFHAVSEKMQELSKKPWELVTKLTDRIDKHMYEMMFGNELIVDEEGNEIRGFMDMIIINIKKSFQDLNEWLEKNVFSKFSDSLPKFDTIADGILSLFGTDYKSVKKKFKDTFVGEGSLVYDFRKQVANDLNDIAAGIITPTAVLKISKIVERYAYDQSMHNEDGQTATLAELIVAINEWKPGGDKGKELKEDLLQMCNNPGNDKNKTITNVLVRIKETGYRINNTVFGILSHYAEQARDYIFGHTDLMDVLSSRFADLNEDTNLSAYNSLSVNRSKFNPLARRLLNFNPPYSEGRILELLLTLVPELQSVQTENEKEARIKRHLANVLSSVVDPKTAINKLKEFIGRLRSHVDVDLAVQLSELIRRLPKVNDDGSISSSPLENVPIPSIPTLGSMSANPSVGSPSTAESPTTGMDIPQYAEGLDKVPYDDYLAYLHQDEAVITKDANKMIPAIYAYIKQQAEATRAETTISNEEYSNRMTKDIKDTIYSYNPYSETDKMIKGQMFSNYINMISSSEYMGSSVEDQKEMMNKYIEQMKQEFESNEDIKKDKENRREPLIVGVRREFNNLFTNVNRAIFGTKKEDQEKNPEEAVDNAIQSNFEKVKKDIFANFRAYLPKMGSGALLGMLGAGALGLVGGPLVWGGLGAGMALAKNSKSFNELLFGEIEDGKRKGGLIPKKIIDAFGKYAPEMKKNGVTGAALGLLPFMPFGPLTGLIGGTVWSFAKRNQEVQEFLYGKYDEETGTYDDSGLLSPRFKKFAEGIMPRAVVGGVTGMVLSAVGGPFGIVGGTAIGAAMGIASKSQKFTEFLLGKEDKDGKLKGGLIGFFKEKALDLTFFIKENMLKPVTKMLKPLAIETLHIGKKIVKGVTDKIGWIFEKLFGGNKFLSFIGKHIGNLFKGIGWLATKGIGTLVSMPFRGLTHMRHKLIKKQIEGGYGRYSTEDMEENINYLAENPTMMHSLFRKYKSRSDYLKEQEESKKNEDKSSENTNNSNEEVVSTISETTEEVRTSNSFLQRILDLLTRKFENQPNTENDGSSDDENPISEDSEKEKNSEETLKDAMKESTDKTPSVENDMKNISKEEKPDETSMLTQYGELPFRQDHTGDYKPVETSPVAKRIKEEEDRDNLAQDLQVQQGQALLDASGKNKDKDNKEEGGLFSTIGKFIGGAGSILKMIPIGLALLPLIPTIINNLPEIIDGTKKAISVIWDVAKRVTQFLDKFNIGDKGDAEEGEVEGGGYGEGILEGATQFTLGGGWKNFARNKLLHGKGIIEKGIRFGIKGVGKGLSATGRFLAKHTKLGAKAASLGAGAANVVKNMFSKLMTNPRVVKILGKDVTKAVMKLPEMVAKKVGKEGMESLGKKLAGFFGPIAIGFMIYDFWYGHSHADEILNIEGYVPFSVRIVSGLVNMLNERFFFGLVPKKFLLATVIKLMPKNIQEAVAEGQVNYKDMVDAEYESENSETISFDEYGNETRTKSSSTSISDRRNKREDRRNSRERARRIRERYAHGGNRYKYAMGSGPRWNYPGAPSEGATVKETNTIANRKMELEAKKLARKADKLAMKNDSRELSGLEPLVEETSTPTSINIPFYSQLDSKWKSEPFNLPEDTIKQTIGDSGCGPTVAAMAISGLTNETIDPIATAKYAIENSLKGKDDGVKPDYMPSILNSRNIPMIGIDNVDQSNESKDLLKKSITEGPTIIMGKGGIFGQNKHYMISVSADDKNVVYHNPESSEGNSKTTIENVLKNTISAIKLSQVKYDENGNIITTDQDNISSTDTSSEDPLEGAGDRSDLYGQISRAGEILVKAMLGLDYSDAIGAAVAGADGGTIPSGSGGTNYKLPENKKAFLKEVAKNAIDLQKKYNVLPSVHVAQALHESGWGLSELAKQGKNLFGIKANNWNGPTISFDTKEFINGGYQTVKKVPWRKYNTFKESQEDYCKLISGAERYKGAIGEKDAYRCISAIIKGGYATSPTYVPDIMKIIEGRSLILLDQGKWDEFLKTFEASESGGIVGGGEAMPGDPRGAVAKMKEWEKKLEYSQTSYRNPLKGTADCSSTVGWAYKLGSNEGSVLKGGYTGGQVNLGKTVDEGPAKGKKGNVANLKPGDLLFYGKGGPNSGQRPYGVSHVEMYIGDGKRSGHGGGSSGKVKGPSVSDFNPNAKDYIHAKRILETPTNTASNNIVSRNSQTMMAMGNKFKYAMGSGPEREYEKSVNDVNMEYALGPLDDVNISSDNINSVVDTYNKNNPYQSNVKSRIIKPSNLKSVVKDISKSNIVNSDEPYYASNNKNDTSDSKIEKLLAIIIEALSNIVSQSNNLSIIVQLLSEGINIKNLSEEIKNPDKRKTITNIINGNTGNQSNVNSSMSNLVKSMNEIIAQP